jgi:DNA-binding SARP family transcriptional activator/tetratricopeptide (TPR) repeat protein
MSAMADLEFRVLGPVTVFKSGRPAPLARGKLTDLLAMLAVSPNQVVSAENLTETVWHDRPPQHPLGTLQSAITRLRQLIGAEFIETHPLGYRLRATADSLDLLRFKQAVTAAEQEQDGDDAFTLLTQAIGLWRGAPLENVSSPALLDTATPRLQRLRLDAHEKWAALCLGTGQHDRVVSTLAPLVDEHPLRERMTGQLMLGLYRGGQPADAVAAFETLRHALSEQLGIDPGPELRDLHLKMLRGDPSLAGSAVAGQPTASGTPARGAPQRLPTDTGMFTGRDSELTQLLDLGRRAAEGQGTVVISAIDGMAGIGKTALAVHAAHLLASRFGDGQLFMDLHGYTEGYPPRTADQVLETFLRALGVPPHQIPQDTEERAALYRDRLAGTRTLIVLDNAADEAQVRPLIPGRANCLILVTSRRKLRALDDAHSLALDVLPGPEAAGLFRRITGPARAAADDPALAEVTELCGRLPLAVRIAAALLRSRPAWTSSHLLGKLCVTGSRLDAFADGDRNLAALFDLSLQALDDGQRRLYRYLGLIPCLETDALAAAALLGTDPNRADELLQGLVDHNLLQESAASRYRMHDLIRTHARSLSVPEAERSAATARLFRYYAHTAGQADVCIARYPRPAPTGPAPAHGPVLPGPAAARAWLRTERANLEACLQAAIDSGPQEHVVTLSQGLTSLLRIDGPWPLAAKAHTAAVTVASRLGDRSGQAHALTELASLRRLTADYADAETSLREALDLYLAVGDKSGQARVLTEMGSVARMLGDFVRAEHRLQEALALYEAVQEQSGQAFCLTELATIRYISGDYQDSDVKLQAALELCRATGDKAGQALCLTELAEIRRLTGDVDTAATNAEAALAICRELGDRLGEANALTVVGKALRLTGDHDAAARCQQAALDVYRELGDRLGQANTRTLLAEVRGLAGDYDRAARDLEESIATYQDMGNRGNEAWALNHYGAVLSAAGDTARAIISYRDALRLSRETGQPDDEANALRGLGDNYLRTGRCQDGAAYLRQALEIYQQLGMPAAEQVSERLADLA